MPGAIDFRAIDPNATHKGIARAQALQAAIARMQAGRALAGGDRQGAMQTLQGAGQIDQAQAVQKYGWEEDDRVTKLDDNKRKESAQFTADVASGLNRVYNNFENPEEGKAAVLQMFEQLQPLFAQRGADEQTIAILKQNLDKDPGNFLAYMDKTAQEAMKRFSAHRVENDLVILDQKEGDTRVAHSAPKVMNVPRGGTAIEIPASPTDGSVNPPADTGEEATSDQIAEAVKRAYPNAVITSGARTPERNAQVNGVPDSMHVTENAIDMAPLPGVEPGDIIDSLAQQGITVTETDIKDNHWHFGTRKRGADTSLQRRAPRVVAQGQRDNFRPATAEEAARYGRTAGEIETTTGRFRPTDSVAKPPGGAAGGQGGVPKLPAQQEITLGKLREERQKLRTVGPKFDEFLSINRKAGTGGLMALPGAGSVVGAVNPDIGRLQQLSDEFAPLMRNGLPGSASDADIRMFKNAAPSLTKPYETNLANREAFKAASKRQGDYLAFLEAFARDNGTILGAQEIWDGYADANPLFKGVTKDGRVLVNQNVKPWRSEIKTSSGAAGSSSDKPVRRWNPETRRLE